ncbi:MAG: sigma factor-like helix-turn-helix DNA-binding protein [Candidatus Methanoperedens sp.]
MLTHEEIRQIIQMRGLGYSQQEIADELGISRKTVENHLSRLREQAEEAEEGGLDNLFWGILLGAGALALLANLLNNNQQRGGGNR